MKNKLVTSHETEWAMRFLMLEGYSFIEDAGVAKRVKKACKALGVGYKSEHSSKGCLITLSDSRFGKSGELELEDGDLKLFQAKVVLIQEYILSRAARILEDTVNRMESVEADTGRQIVKVLESLTRQSKELYERWYEEATGKKLPGGVFNEHELFTGTGSGDFHRSEHRNSGNSPLYSGKERGRPKHEPP